MVAQRLPHQLPHQINFGNVWKLLGLLYPKNTSKVSLNQCRGVWQRNVELKTRTGTKLRLSQRVYTLEVQSTENPDDPLNDCTFTNPISRDMLSDPNDSSSVLARVSRHGRVIKAPEKLDLFNLALYVFESKGC
ncbi:hypothetical protein TNCV_2113191 [Trichonephila clavipes]|nr:hypothetical protein TNCV_2113191 [Trichonephila clavipes]